MAVASVGDRRPVGGAASSAGAPAPAAGVGGGAGAFLDALLQSKSELFRGSRDVLRDSYVPPRLPHREEEIRKVAEILGPALRGDLPSNLLIYGKIGTGKTAVVAQVRHDIERRAGNVARLGFITINCANIDTSYSLLQTIGNVFAANDAERIPTGWSLDRVQAAMRRMMDARRETTVLVLD